MSWGLYEIGRATGYEEGRSAVKTQVLVDHSAVYAAVESVDWANAKVDAYRRAIAKHPERAKIEQEVAVYWPRYYGWRRIKGFVGAIIKLAGWLLALNLITAQIFGY
jgi:hypothetical protein